VLVNHGDEGVARIILNAPPLNLIDNKGLAELDLQVRSLESDVEVRAVVIAGAVGANFSAGSDIKEFARIQADTYAAQSRQRYENEVFDRIARLPQPTIAAIEGACLGSGLELALCCDFRVAAATSRLGLPEVTIGIIAGSGGLLRITRLLGQQRARRLVLAGRVVTASEALMLELIDEVVAQGQATDRATQLATEMARIPALAFRRSKEAIQRIPDLSDEEAAEYILALTTEINSSADAVEGIRAFVEKRPPRFGRSRE
jgi:enoyl-CoA hydratase